MSKDDELSQETIELATASWSPAVRFVDVTESTNSLARQWATEGAPEGSVVVADHQTAGRGRMGRSWMSPPGGGLLFSVILRPALSPERVPLINLVAAASLARALTGLGFDATVKWPNDVRIGGKKVSGILSEAVEHAGTPVILGVGVNVNLSKEDLPEELQESATSLFIESGKVWRRVEVLSCFLDAFGPRYSGVGDPRNSELLNDYKRWCDTIGRAVRVHLSSGSIEGMAVDVDANGNLLMDSGQVVSAGDVVHLREPD